MELTALQQLVHQMYIAYYQRPADPEGLQYWVEQLEQNGDWSTVSAAFGAPENTENQALYGDLTREETIAAIYQSAFNRAAVEAEVQFWAESEFSATDLTFAIVNGAQNDDLTTVNNKVEFSALLVQQVETNAAFAQLEDPKALLAAVTAETTVNAEYVSSAVASGTTGETFSLTADNAGEIFVGTANNDTFTAEAGSLVGTSIDGQGGNDTLNATYAGATDFNATPTIRNVENVNINLDVIAGNTDSIDAANVRGATITLASERLGFNGVAGATNVAANNLTAGNNVTALTVAGLTTGTVNTGAANTASVTTANATDVANVTVNGDIDLSIVDATNAVLTSTANASVDLTAAAATKLTVAGSGDVTLMADDLAGDEIVNQKTDGTLTASVAATADVGDWNVDNIQVTATGVDLTDVALAPIELTSAGQTFTAAGKSATTSNVVISTAVNQTSVTVTNANSATVNLTAAATVGTLDVGAIDTTVNAAAASTITTLTSTGEVAFVGEGSVTITGATTASEVNASGLTGKLTLESGANDSVVVAGAGGLEYTTGATTQTVSVTGNTGADVVDASSIIANGTIVFSGGAGNDKLTISGTGAQTVVFDGGAGNDTLVLAGGTNLTTANVTLANVETIDVDGMAATVKGATLNGQSYTITGDGFGTSTLTVAVADGNSSVDLSGLNVTDSAATGVAIAITGGNGNDTIVGTSNADTITIANGSNTLTGGAGADTFAITLGRSVVTDFAAGEDKVDTIDVANGSGLATSANIATFLNSVDGITGAQAADISIIQAGDAALAAVFEFGGQVHVAASADQAFDIATDGFVTLTGVTAADVTAAGGVAELWAA